MARGGKGAKQRNREGIKFFNGSLDEYIRVQQGSHKDWLVIVNLLGTSRLMSMPYKRYAMMVQAALIELGREECLKYLEGGHDETQEGHEASESASGSSDASD